MKKMFVMAAFAALAVGTVLAQKAEIFNDKGVAVHGYDVVAYFTKGACAEVYYVSLFVHYVFFCFKTKGKV